jgi:hypothetical protein
MIREKGCPTGQKWSLNFGECEETELTLLRVALDAARDGHVTLGAVRVFLDRVARADQVGITVG